MTFGPKLDNLIDALKSSLENVRKQTNGSVFLDIKQIESPPQGTGVQYAVQFKVRGRPVYSAHLFYFWADIWNDQIIIEWEGRPSFYDPMMLRVFIHDILNDEVVKKSIRQLCEFAQGTKEGVVKTIDPDTLGAMDFLIDIPDEEFQKIESAFNQQTSILIKAQESIDRTLPGAFNESFISRYQFLDTQGMIMNIENITKENGILNIKVYDVR